MDVARNNKGFPRKHLAQDRLVRIKDEMRQKRILSGKEFNLPLILAEQTFSACFNDTRFPVGRDRDDVKRVISCITEKLEKFANLQRISEGASSPMDIVIDKFLPNANQVNIRDVRNAMNTKQAMKRKLNEDEVVSKETKCSKSSPAGSHNVHRSSGGDSKELSKSARQRKRSKARKAAAQKLNLHDSQNSYSSSTPTNSSHNLARKDAAQKPYSHENQSSFSVIAPTNSSNNLARKDAASKPNFRARQNSFSSGVPINSNDHKYQSCNQNNLRKRKAGLGSERLEKARKTFLENAIRNGRTPEQYEKMLNYTEDEPSMKPPNETFSNEAAQPPAEQSTAKGSAFSFSKPPSETRSNAEQSAFSFAKLPLNAGLQAARKPQQPVATEFTSSLTKLESSTSSADYNTLECDMDVDMDDDVAGPSLSANANRMAKKWSERKEKEISLNLDEIERIREDSTYLARLEPFIEDVEMNLTVPNGDFLIIVDTNIFLSHLRFVDSLLKSTISNYRTHVLVVPWVVLQELDYAMKKKDERLASQARTANHFVFDCLKKERENFFGQSFDDFKFNFKKGLSVDDYLLQYCLKLIALRNNVVLLTDDKNLCNKCMFCNVGAYTRDEFEKTFEIRPLK